MVPLTEVFAVTLMHLVSVWPGVMLATWNRALPASSSVRLTAPVAQSFPELRVVPLKAAYDDCHTRADAARMATGVAAAAAILPARAEGVRIKELLEKVGVSLYSGAR